MVTKKVDLTVVLNKLTKAGLVEMHDKGYKGVFSIKDHSHLLDPKELDAWIAALHSGSRHDDKTCMDGHAWNVEMLDQDKARKH
jgi:hypothetical protein